MPELARKYEERYYYYGEQRRTCTAMPDRRPFGQNVVPVKKYKHTQPKRQRHAKADKDVFIDIYSNLLANRILSLFNKNVISPFNMLLNLFFLMTFK